MQENLFCLVGEVRGSTSHWEKKPQRQHLTIEASFWKERLKREAWISGKMRAGLGRALSSSLPLVCQPAPPSALLPSHPSPPQHISDIPPNIWNVGQHGWRLLQNSLVFCTDSTYTDSIFLLSNFFNNSPNHLYTASSHKTPSKKSGQRQKHLLFMQRILKWNPLLEQAQHLLGGFKLPPLPASRHPQTGSELIRFSSRSKDSELSIKITLCEMS